MRQHHSVGRRVYIEPDDVGELAAKPGSRERLKVRRCAAPNPPKCRWPRPLRGRSNGSPGAAARCRSAPPPAPSFPRRSAPCRACGSCRAADRQLPSRQSAAASATPFGRLTPTLCATRWAYTHGLVPSIAFQEREKILHCAAQLAADRSQILVPSYPVQGCWRRASGSDCLKATRCLSKLRTVVDTMIN
jgi:hypothetical protein